MDKTWKERRELADSCSYFPIESPCSLNDRDSFASSVQALKPMKKTVVERNKVKKNYSSQHYVSSPLKKPRAKVLVPRLHFSPKEPTRNKVMTPVEKTKTVLSKKARVAAPPANATGKEFYMDAAVLKNVRGAIEQQKMNMSSGTSFPAANHDAAYQQILHDQAEIELSEDSQNRFANRNIEDKIRKVQKEMRQVLSDTSQSSRRELIAQQQEQVLKKV